MGSASYNGGFCFIHSRVQLIDSLLLVGFRQIAAVVINGLHIGDCLGKFLQRRRIVEERTVVESLRIGNGSLQIFPVINGEELKCDAFARLVTIAIHAQVVAVVRKVNNRQAARIAASQGVGIAIGILLVGGISAQCENVHHCRCLIICKLA